MKREEKEPLDLKYTRFWWEEQHHKGLFGSFEFNFSYTRIVERFKLREDTKILEIGFAYGRELSQFCNISKNVYGAEISSKAVEIAYQKIRELNCKYKPKLDYFDGIHLPFHKQEKFDLIYSCFVTQHMSKKNMGRLIKDALTRLEPDGKILFEFCGYPEFISEDTNDVITNDAFSTTDKYIYNNGFSETQLIQFLKKYNVDFIEEWFSEYLGETFNNYWVCIKLGR